MKGNIELLVSSLFKRLNILQLVPLISKALLFMNQFGLQMQ